MKFLPIVYLAYMFISLYFLSFYLLLYNRGRKTLFESPKLKKHFTVSVLIPAYNEEDTIENTIEAVLDSDYDRLIEVIVLNDGSKDRTVEIVKKLMKKYDKLKLLDKSNSGKADSINLGIKNARGELVAVVDSDSFPKKDAIRKMIGFFEDEKVGAVTIPILARNKKRFFEKLQALEYLAIAITRKLLERVEAIYVTPGPLALYRKKALIEIGGFDPENLTEDIEVTWHMGINDWDRKMCLDTNVTTLVPKTFKPWFKQRRRWSMGGLQTMWKYRSHIGKKDIFGFFVLPFFILSSFLGLVGLSIFVYLLLSRLIKEYLFVKFSFIANTAIVTLNDFYFTPSVLNYLGVVLFLFGAIFTLLLIYLIKENIKLKGNVFTILFYMIVYMVLYPFIMVTAIFKLIRRDMSW
ncbi:hypothetical protein CMI44_00970 [Candidatus Pacearchaeota archaeon]|nr:hypothetical protein [Candidatus Pacearchaeota archaeon]|tara:strand:- start:28 stop:1251 length:1224 start_codon:yes stop_codon:yes gene_type:complete